MGIIGKAFVGMDVLDGMKKVPKAYNERNKYDDIIKSQSINNLEKRAGFANGISSASNRAKILMDKVDYNGAKHLIRAKSMRDIGNKKEYVKEVAKTIGVNLPAVTLALGAGVGTEKMLKKLDRNGNDDNRNLENDLEAKALGGIVSGALALNAIHTKRPLNGFINLANMSKVKAIKYPLKAIKKSSKTGKLFAETAKEIGKHGKAMNKNVKPTRKRSKKYVPRIVMPLSKATDFSKQASVKDAARYSKELFVDHFLQKGIESIPYYAAPAALSAAINRDIQHGRCKTKIDEKKASLSFSNNKEFLKLMAEKSAEGLGRTVVPGTVGALTGRNIMNAFRPLEDERPNIPVENMQSTITLVVNGKPTARKISKAMKEKMEKTSSVEDIIENLEKKIEKDGRASYKKPVYNGQKKKFRMNR